MIEGYGHISVASVLLGWKAWYEPAFCRLQTRLPAQIGVNALWLCQIFMVRLGEEVLLECGFTCLL